MMVYRMFFFCVFFVTGFGPAFAQVCDPPFETVTRLHKPVPGAYTVWNAVYGAVQYDEAFDSVLTLGAAGHVLAVGRQISVLNGFSEMKFVTYDRLGRVVGDKALLFPGLERVVKVLKNPAGGYVVLANIQKGELGHAWLGFLDERFGVTSYRVFGDSRDSFQAHDVIPAAGSGWVISVSHHRSYGEGRSRIETVNGVVYLLDAAGKNLTERRYSPGGDNIISSLRVLKIEGAVAGYIATGYFINNAGKQIGWALRLDPDLSLSWQKEFRRGLSAKIKAAQPYFDEFLLVAGDVLPSNGHPMGVWLGLLNVADGRLWWQRYFYGESDVHAHFVQGLEVNADHLIMLMLQVESLERPDYDPMQEDVVVSEFADYVHVLSLSPRGVLQNGDTYFYGHGARISQLVLGADGTRVMAGSVLVPAVEADVHAGEGEKVVAPIIEESRVFLPESDLSPRAKKGLELLQKKIKTQEVVALNESAKKNDGFMRKGWVVIGDKFDAYSDLCRK